MIKINRRDEFGASFYDGSLHDDSGFDPVDTVGVGIDDKVSNAESSVKQEHTLSGAQVTQSY